VSESTDLFAQQEANRRRSRRLVIGFVLFFAWLGFGGDWIAFLATRDAPPPAYHHTIPFLGIALSLIAIGVSIHAWRRGPEQVLWAAGAHELRQATSSRDQQLRNVVEEMAIAAGLPVPRIWIIPDPDPNAFATGYDERSASVAVTTGLLELCTRDELQGVIGHELAHIKNVDVRLMTLLAALVGTVALISEGLGRMLRSSRGSGGRVRLGGSSRSRSPGRGGPGGGAVVLILFVVWALSWLLAPLITRLLALGVSRSREYLADAMSAQFTRNPMALANALQKIEQAAAPTTSIARGTAHLCIADPLGRRANASQSRLAELLGTHPPMAIRVARLKAMAYQRAKAEGGPIAPQA
jgi:heat shock protein HtpX